MAKRVITLALCAWLVSSVAWADTDTVTFTIASSATNSDVQDIRDFCIGGLELPASWDGTTINAECAVGSTATGDMKTLYEKDGSTQWSVTHVDGYLDLTQTGNSICGCRFVRLVAGTTQTSERTVKAQLAN